MLPCSSSPRAHAALLVCDRSPMNEDTRKLFRRFFAVAVVALLIVVGTYFLMFARGSGFALSQDTEEWARFGEYVGGTLSAIFGLLAFAGVLLTIREQRHQGVLEEFQRQISLLAQRAEVILAEEPAEANPADMVVIQRLGGSRSIYALLKRIGIQAMRDPDKDPAIRAMHEELQQATVLAIKRQLNVLQIELQHLVWCFEKYVEMGGDQTIIDLYTRRYQPVVCWIHVLGMTESEPVRDWFQPDNFRSAWRAANVGGAREGPE